MKKRNLIIQAAIAGVFSVASLSAIAGIANGFSLQIATQAVPTAATVVGSGSLAYSTQSPIAIGVAYVYVKLNSGATFAQTAGGTINALSLVAANVGAATITVGTGIVSADQTFAAFPVTVSVASLPVNATFTFKPVTAAAADGGIANAVAAAGTGSLTATMSIGSTNTPATNVVGSNIDSPSTGTILNFVTGEAFTALQSGAFTAAGPAPFVAVGGETAKVNVTSGSGVALINNINVAGSTSLIDFGGYYFKDTSVAGSLVYAANGTTVFNIATNYTVPYSAVVTGNFAAAQAAGGSVFLSSSSTCAPALAATSVINAAGTTATITGIPALATNVPVYVCMQLSTANAVPVPATTPSIVVTLVGTTAATANIVTPASSLYALTTNGVTHDVMDYIPSTAAGYTTFIRVINTGGVTADVSAAVIDQTTGVAGTSAVISPALKAGGAVTLSSAQIEAAIGVIANGTTRPRLRITGPSTFTVQSFILTNANGNFSEVSSSE